MEGPQTGVQTRPQYLGQVREKRDADSWPCGPDRWTGLGKSLYRRVWLTATIFSQSPRHARVGVTGRWGIEAVQVMCIVSPVLLWERLAPMWQYTDAGPVLRLTHQVQP